MIGQLKTGREVGCALGQLRQGNHPAVDHAIRFCILIAESQWNDKAFSDIITHNSEEKDRLTMVDLPSSLEALVESPQAAVALQGPCS